MIDIKKYVSTPIEVTWDITSKCNLACSFCLENSLDVSACENITNKDRWNIVNEIIKSKVLIVNISGGEPLLITEITDYISAMTKGGCGVNLTTNGLLLTSELAAELKIAGIRRVEVTIYPEVIEKSLDAIKVLKENGIKTAPRAVFTRKLRPQLPYFLKKCQKAGIDRIVMQEVVPLGRGLDNFKEFELTEKENLDATKRIKELTADFESFEVLYTSSTIGEMQSECAIGCVIALDVRKRCEIRPDGNVIPCSIVSIYDVKNNIHEKGLKQCWLDVPRLYKPLLEETARKTCKGCAIADNCAKGCPADHEKLLRRGKKSGPEICRFYKTILKDV